MKIDKRLSLLVLLLAAPAFAQTPPKPPGDPAVPDVPTVTAQLAAAGCQSERQIAAQTIVNLQKKVDDLQRQVDAAKATGKSGATKH